MHIYRYILINFYILLCTYIYTDVVVQHPMNTTVCEDDNAVFTCVVLVSSGTVVAPGWVRDGTNVDMMRHTVADNLTSPATSPVNISSTVTVSNVTSLDDAALYHCGILSFVTSNSATLTVVGKCIPYSGYN